MGKSDGKRNEMGTGWGQEKWKTAYHILLTPHWLGAYNAPPPLAYFLNNFKTRAVIDAKRTVPYSASIWHPKTKFQQNPSIFLENGVLVTSCHSIWGRKSANIQMLLECTLKIFLPSPRW